MGILPVRSIEKQIHMYALTGRDYVFKAIQDFLGNQLT